MIGISLISDLSKDNIKKVKIGYVVPNSPAAKKGLLKNDIILKINQKIISTPSDVVNAINANGIDKFGRLSIKRENKISIIKVKPKDIRELTSN